MSNLRVFFALVLFLLIPQIVSATEFFVTASGTAGGDGSASRPWDFKTALNHPGSVKPGDTIWVRAGTYTYRSETLYGALKGTPTQPVIIRAYPGERVKIEASITVGQRNDHDAWYWGFEIVNRDTSTLSEPPGFNVASSAHYISGIKIINNILHDNKCTGLNVWKGASNFEAFGNIIYNNGFQGGDRAHCHGVYIQSDGGPQEYNDNVIFRNLKEGMQLYGTGATKLNGVRIVGNTYFNTSAEISNDGAGSEMSIGAWAGTVAQDMQARENMVYKSPHLDRTWVQFGMLNSPVITGNYFMIGENRSGLTFNWQNTTTGTPVITGNTVLSYVYDESATRFPSNSYLTKRPSGQRIFVRPNRYEPGRANIIIYNWDLSPSVSVNISSVLSSGRQFEIRDVNNFFGSPVLSGTYQGGTISIPMTGLTIAPPVGSTPKVPKIHTGPEFGTFVLIPKGLGGTVDSMPPAAPSGFTGS